MNERRQMMDFKAHDVPFIQILPFHIVRKDQILDVWTSRIPCTKRKTKEPQKHVIQMRTPVGIYRITGELSEEHCNELMAQIAEKLLGTDDTT
jgi:hypothetical protein